MSIRTLNLDSMFVPVPYPEIEFEKSTFKGGEQHIKLNTKIDYSKVEKVIITHRIQTAEDTMHILVAYDALRWLGIEKFDLIIPYIPYARQDRVCNPGESSSLIVFANLINSMKFEKIHVIDAHSDVAPALLSSGQNRCFNHSNSQYVESALCDMAMNGVHGPLLISPDSGANKKMNKLFEEFKTPRTKHDIHVSDLIKCDKRRNLSDMSLSGFEILSKHSDLEEKSCLIVDDICDGGRTFIGLAEELKKNNAGDIYLFVTHGIFSYGFEQLRIFKKIYCTNSFKDIAVYPEPVDYINDLVKQFKIQL